MATRYTVSPHGSGFAVFDDGEFFEAPPSGTWGAAKKIANRLNDGLRPVHMKYKVQLAKDNKDFVSGPDWVVERKWDGMRALFQLSEDETLIFSRTGQDLRLQYPELADLHERVGVPCVLDGEIVCMVEDDKEDLELLQNRISQKNPSSSLLADAPATVKFFDLLEGPTGINATPLRLWERRELLSSVLEGTEFDTPQLLPTGEEIPSHWEGTVSKNLDSVYMCGKRRATWLKYKFVQRATLQATSLTPGKGARASYFGAVVVADAHGVIRGQVGSGFTQSDIDALMKMDADENLPLIEVEYRFLSKSGLMVNTAFKGIRTDKMEADVL